MRATIRDLNIRRQTRLSLADIARTLNPLTYRQDQRYHRRDVNRMVVPGKPRPLSAARDDPPAPIPRFLERGITREALLSYLLAARPSIFIGGPTGFGKTSLLNYIAFEMKEKGELVALGPYPLSRIATSSTEIQSAVESVQRDNRQRTRIVVVLDDLGGTPDATRREILIYLARLVQDASRLVQVVCAGNFLEDEIEARLGPICAFTDIYMLEPFDEYEMREFLPIRDDQAAARFAELSGGIPLVAQALGLELEEFTSTHGGQAPRASDLPSRLELVNGQTTMTLLAGVLKRLPASLSRETRNLITALVEAGTVRVDWNTPAARVLRRCALVRRTAATEMTWSAGLIAEWFRWALPNYEWKFASETAYGEDFPMPLELPEPSEIVQLPVEEIEPRRYTDLTIYEGHLYPSDDLTAATRLPDKVPLAADSVYTLEVAVRLKRSGIDSDRDAPRSVKNPRQDNEELTVYVLAKPQWPGVEIKEPFAKITWPYDADSESALFRLHTKSVGRGEMSQGTIEVRLIDHSLDLLDIVRVFLTVVPDGEPVLGAPAPHLLCPDKEPGVPHIDANAPQRLLSIHVTPFDKGYRFQFLFRASDGNVIEIPVSRDIHAADIDNLLIKVRDFWTNLVITNYKGKLTVTRTTFETYLRQLKYIGVDAWSLLFGTRYADQAGASENLGELLKSMEITEGTHIQITYSDTYSHFIFPWSILYPPAGDSTAVDPLRFWGARYQIEQVTAGPKRDALTDEPISILFALDPNFGNAASQKELLGKYKAAAGSKLLITDPISDQETLFKELARNPSAHLLYFYCHGYASTRPGALRPDGVLLLKRSIAALPAASPERQALETLFTLTAKMGDESWMYIGQSEITESNLKLQRFFEKRRPIVFLNMCQSADLLPSMSRGLVRVFLEHNASAVVGTESVMTSVFANAFAEALFDALFGGADIGTALWGARRRFLGSEIRNPLGLAYTLYGRTTARLGTRPIIAALASSDVNTAASNH